MSKINIRVAVTADLRAVAHVQARTMVASDDYEDSRDEDAEFERLYPRVAAYVAGTHHPSCALPERTLLVAAREGQIIGFAAGHRSTRMGCNAELQWIFVLPLWQRSGVGGQLLEPLRAWFKEHECTKVIVDAPPGNSSRAFYLKHGAKPLDEYWLYWENIAEQAAL